MPADPIAAYLNDAAAPVPLKKLQKDLCARNRWTADHFAALLTDTLQKGDAFAWPRYRNANRYWYRDPSKVIRNEVLALAADTASPKPALIAQTIRRAHNCGRKPVEEAISRLVKSGELRSAKPLGSPALYFRDASPRALVAGCIALLGERLRKLGIDEPLNLSTAPSTLEPALIDNGLLRTIRRLQPAPGVPVPVQTLRAAFPDSAKQEFDHGVLSLADQQKLYLTTHDHGWALSEAEREQLVWDGGQKLYVAVTIRD